MDYRGKRLLVLAGASVHVKLVEAARNMGVYTIVTDNVINSPAKIVADKYYDVDIFNIDQLEKMCKQERIDGIISGYIDPCQIVYNQLCERVGVPCYGTKEQFGFLTNKQAFKKLCVSNGVDVIPEYSEQDVKLIKYPVFVKPVDSRGSRGQSICFNDEQLKIAMITAKRESSNSNILIEKYIENANEFQVTYFFIDGIPYLIRTCDSYCGTPKNNMQKVVSCSISPSRFTASYLKNTHHRVIKMLKSIGIKNGPVFMQGFEDNGIFRFFDPGLRFPGVDYEKVYKKIFGIDLMQAMVIFALKGNFEATLLPTDSFLLDGKIAAILFPTIQSGVIKDICGVEDIEKTRGITSFWARYSVGDRIAWSYDINQRFAEIDCIADDIESMKRLIMDIQNKLEILDEFGNDLKLELFDPERIKV